LAIEKLRSHPSPGVDQIPVEWIKAGVEEFTMTSITYYFYLEKGGIA